MRQCRLRRGRAVQVAWIPARFAAVGKYLRILDVDGWKVEAVWSYQKSVETPHGYFAGGVRHRVS